MAALQGACVVSGLALSAATATTVLQLVAPTNQRLKILEYVFSFDGTNSANTPCLVSIERQTGGTFTNTAVAPSKINDPSGSLETLQGSYKTAMTVAPTSGNVLRTEYIPVFGGVIVWPQTPGQEDLIPGGTILGVKMTAPQAVNCTVTVRYEE